MKTIKERNQEIYDYMHSLDLKTSDFDSSVSVYHSDGSVFKFKFAKIEERDEFVCVWTEHNGYHFWKNDDLVKIKTFKDLNND
jgi:hypothetical protein